MQDYQLATHCRLVECAYVVKDSGFGCREFDRLLPSCIQIIVRLVHAAGYGERVVLLRLFRLQVVKVHYHPVPLVDCHLRWEEQVRRDAQLVLDCLNAFVNLRKEVKFSGLRCRSFFSRSRLLEQRCYCQ